MMNLYLSQIVLDPRSPLVRAILANPYELHRTLLKAFPEHLPESERVLYRLEAYSQNLDLLVLVQSQTLPDWVYLETGGLVLQASRVKRFAPKFHVGQVLTFRLLANPTKRLKQNGKRIGLDEERDQLQWLERKANYGGFDLVKAVAQQQGMISGVKFLESQEYTLRHYGVLYRGELMINDIEIFIQTIQYGIGSAKGFGFGMLSVA
jgi:CRISPR system Cascade subunit CasE